MALRRPIAIAACAGLGLFMAFALGRGLRASTQGKSQTHVVRMENMRFSPSVAHVRVGDVVEFKNADLVPHTVTAKPAGAFDSGSIKAGESWTLVAREPGAFSYVCTYHPMMTGELHVAAR